MEMAVIVSEKKQPEPVMQNTAQMQNYLRRFPNMAFLKTGDAKAENCCFSAKLISLQGASQTCIVTISVKVQLGGL